MPSNSLKGTAVTIQQIVSNETTDHTQYGMDSTYPFVWFVHGVRRDPDPAGLIITEFGMATATIGHDGGVERKTTNSQETAPILLMDTPIKSDKTIERMDSIDEYGVCCLSNKPFFFYVDWDEELTLKKVVFKDAISWEVEEEHEYKVSIRICSMEEDGKPIEVPNYLRGTLTVGERVSGRQLQFGETSAKPRPGRGGAFVCTKVAPFIQKYGHTEIVMANEKGASGTGQLSTDGYSVGYSTTVRLGESTMATLKFRGNIPLAIPSAPPAITLSVEANSALEMEVLCTTTDPFLEDAPKAVLQIQPYQKNEARFEVGKVTTNNVPIEKDEATPVTPATEEEKDPVAKGTQVFLPIAKSSLNGDHQDNLLILSNHSIGYLTHVNSQEQILGQIWIAIATEESKKVEGQDYWYLIGGEEEEPPYRGIDLIEMKILRPGARSYEGVWRKEAIIDTTIDGAILPLGIYYRIQVTALIGAKKPMVKVELMGVKGFKGYLDIVSDIAFDFYQDGEIRIDLPPNRQFTFTGK